MRAVSILKNITMKYAIVLLLFISILLNMGCLTGIMIDHVSRPDICAIKEDYLYGIAVPDEKSKQAIGNNDVIIFLGKKNTYFITEGGNQILDISKSLDSANLRLIQEAYSPRISVTGQNIQGSICLSYKSGTNSTILASNLLKLGFKESYRGDNYYTIDINIKGTVYSPITTHNISYKNVEPRLFQYCQMERRSIISKMPKQMIPVFIVVDIASLPAQAFIGIPISLVALGGH